MMWWRFFLIEERKPALTNSSRALAVLFPDNRFPSKDAAKVPTSVDQKPPFCSFVSFLIVLVTPFNRIFESSKV